MSSMSSSWNNTLLSVITGRVTESTTTGYQRRQLFTVWNEYSKNPHIRTLSFEGQAAVTSYLMITKSCIRLLGS